MIFSCPCGTTIEIPASQVAYLYDSEIERQCIYESKSPINDPWKGSHLENSGKIQEKKYKPTSLDDIDYEDDETDEEDDGVDTDMSLTGDWE